MALVACAQGPEGPDTSTTSPAREGEDPVVPTGAFFLDLRTGEETPLPSRGAEDFGALVDGGNYYAASPDGSRVIYETTCCDAADVAAWASIDGS